jgi:hypothetical protein
MHEVKTSEKVDPLEIYRVVITRSASLPWKDARDWKRPDPQNRPETPDFRVFRGFPVGPREPPKKSKKVQKKVSRELCRHFFSWKKWKKGVLINGMSQQTKKVRPQRQDFSNVFYRFFKKFRKILKILKSKNFRRRQKAVTAR